MGWAAFKNGRLLSLAQKEFDLFITVDRNLSTQQNLSKFDIAILVLHAKTNRLADLRPLLPEIISSLPNTQKKQIIHIPTRR